MKDYDAEATCPKCGHDEVNTTHCTNRTYEDYGRKLLGGLHEGITEIQEHLDRTCQRCQWQWLESTIHGR